MGLADIAAKAYVDLITDYEEISTVRKDVFLERYTDFFSTDELTEGQEYISKRISKCIEKLNIGYFHRMLNNKVTISHRFDPIGLEVDLFFGCTKFAYPGITGIGNNLFENLYGVKTAGIKQSNFIRNFQLPLVQPDPITFDYLYCKKINKIKGIGVNYKVYYLLKRNDLPTDIDLRIDKNQQIYKETIQLLDNIGFYNDVH